MINIFYSKLPSAFGHIEGSMKVIKEIDIYTILGVNPTKDNSESDIVNFITRFGIIVTIIYLLLFFRVISRCLKIIKHRYIIDQEKALHAGIAMFSISVLIGSINLPFSIMFPINALFVIFLFLSNWEIWEFNRNTIST